MEDNATRFGKSAADYKAARPSYPDALFDWIADRAPGRDLVWDVGTGNGQAAVSLATRFGRVHATDVDEKQIAEATPCANVTYSVAVGHESGLDDACCDAITAATSMHWFDLDAFWTEVRRVARSGAIFAGWVYGTSEVDEEMQSLIRDPMLELVDRWWAEGNRICMRGYPPAELQFPFELLPNPGFACELDWTPRRYLAFIKSWSAYARARDGGLADRLEEIETRALRKLGSGIRRVQMPLSLLAGHVESISTTL